MSFQELSNVKNTHKKSYRLQSPDQPLNSLLINSSFSLGNEQKLPNKQLHSEVLKKVSQIIVSLHSTLVPKTENIEIYRDLTEEEQQMLKLVQDSQLIHTILAGVLAIDSCLKFINKEETYVMSSLMKGVTICLGNYKKMEEEFLASTEGKISQNFLKFYDSLKLIISDIHKIPAAKIKRNQLEKHNDFITKSNLNNELLNSLNREENLLFSLLAQENNSLRLKLKDLEKEISQVEKEKIDLMKEMRNIDSDKKKRDSENNLTETGSESAKGLQQEMMIRELKDEIMEKNDMIIKMNDEFAVEIQKYQKIFKRLEQENKRLKKYSDLDTAYILEELEYEVEMLREEKRNNQAVINQIMSQMNNLAWNRSDANYGNQSYGKEFKPRYDQRMGNFGVGDSRLYQTSRSRCPSVSPSNKQQSIMNRYFSPNFDPRDQRNLYKNSKVPQRRELNLQRDDSPRFGNVPDQKSYQNIKERVTRMNLRKEPFGLQNMNMRRGFKQEIPPMRRSQSKLNGMKVSFEDQRNIDISKLKQEMKRSKFLNEQISYM